MFSFVHDQVQKNPSSPVSWDSMGVGGRAGHQIQRISGIGRGQVRGVDTQVYAR